MDQGNSIKNFCISSATSKTKLRIALLKEVNLLLLEKSAASDGVLQACLYGASQTLDVYHDIESRRECLALISTLITIKPSVCIPSIIRILEPIAKFQTVNSTPNRPESAKSLVALTWSCAVAEAYLTKSLDYKLDWKLLVKVQASLYYGALSCQKNSISLSASKALNKLWKKASNVFESYIRVLTSDEASASSCVLLAALCSFDTASFEQKKVEVLNVYSKAIVSSKFLIPPFALIATRNLVDAVDHQIFESVICPALQRSLLRSSDRALVVAKDIVENAKIDLSRHALVLVKMLTQQLISKTDSNREIAADIVVALASQCSDAGAVDETIKYLFGLLKGSEGKLTVAGQKISVLNAIGGFGSSPIGSGTTATSVVHGVVALFLPILQQGSHDGSALVAVVSFSKWCARLRGDVPKDLVAWLVKAPSLKTSSPSIRIAYVDCAFALFKMDNFHLIEPLLPYLLRTVETAKQQQAQVNLVSEALHASCLLTKIENVDVKKPPKFGNFWNVILDAKTSLFATDKFLQNATDETLLKLVHLSSQLFHEHAAKLNDDITRLFCRSLIFILLNKKWSIASVAEKAIKKLLVSDSGIHVRLALLDQLTVALDDDVIGFAAAEDDVDKRKISSAYCRAMQCCIDPRGLLNDQEAACRVAIRVLVDVHRPAIVQSHRKIFTRYLSSATISSHNFIRDHLKDIEATLVSAEEIDEARLCALKTVVQLAPELVLPLVAKRLSAAFSCAELHKVTKREVEIMNTPDGQLWNMEIVESFPKIVENKNMKRENKAYSFQDQLMEIELRKELEEKKRKDDAGGAQGPGGDKSASRMPANLTKKQQEIVDQELQKEADVRARIRKVQDRFETSCRLFRAVLAANIDGELLLRNLASLVKSLLSLLHYQLSSGRAQDLFVLLTTTILPEYLRILGKQTAYTTLRIYKPTAAVDRNWCFYELNSQVLKILNKLSSSFQSEPQPAAVFCFFFPFLEKILLKSGAIVRKDSDVMCTAMRLLLVHVHFNADSDLLPRSAITSCMCQLIGTSEIKVQELASSVVTAVSRAAASLNHVGAIDEIKILLRSLLSPLPELRTKTMECLIILQAKVRALDEEASKVNALRRVWVAMHDVDENVRELAVDLWNKLRFNASASLSTELLSDLRYHEPVIQRAAASSLHEVLSIHREVASLSLQCLVDVYYEKRERPPPILDDFGRVIAEAAPDDFQPRIGIAYALKEISPDLSEDDIEPLFTFFLSDALCDRHAEVRSTMLEASVQAVNDHGKRTTSILLDLFEDFLKKAPTSQQYDGVRQGVVILLGTLAKHLDKGDPKIKPIVAKLTETLSTPSEAVQESVANCLPSLVPSIKADAPEIVRKLLVILIESNKYGERKGAAYGLAGLVKGLGIISFKQLDIMTTLIEAIQDKKEYKRKEGALMAFEMFCKMLGRLFEPYIVHVLPHLLLCFGDSNSHVRKAANDTARAVMNNLSAHGVRLVLPSLLNGLKSDDSWRTKTGSAELLGAMSYCAPKQLSSCLPSIVPELCEILTDSHHKVQKAGEQALRKIGSVIRNPEIQAISRVLLAALTNPEKVSNCLTTLLNTKFVHFIDAPSLALIIPIVERSFKDRSTETRKMASQIIGNMYSLTDEKDLKPYLPGLLPGLKTTLLDPVPEVRSIAAKALGAMVKVSGESLFEELLPWLIEHLTSEQTSVDRSGAAQGLSEVMASLGPDKLSKLMPDLVKTAGSDGIMPHARDGYLMLFVYLPLTYGDDFIPHISDVVQPLLKGLADENEYVRSTALTAGQRIISMFSEKSISVLLPQLERGLFDVNWRIRLSSVQLVGDLLYHISGITGKMTATGDDDENYGTAQSFQEIENKLGLESRDLALSGLYMGRCDVALAVRQSALHVWKVVVPNTPRVLREILPTLFKLLLGCLASPTYDKRQIAARTLGDIVRKLGERMLPELIPILERGLDSEDPAQREGVCIGLTEIIKSCSREAVNSFSGSLVPTVRKALCDSLSHVRLAASTTFENLHSSLGNQILEGILPPMLELLAEDEEASDAAVDGLKQIITVKGHVVLPYVIPKLIEPPVNTKILSYFSAVAGESLTKHLPAVLKTFVITLIESDGEEQFSSIVEDAEKVILSVNSEHGMRIVVDDLLVGVKNQDSQTRYVNLLLLYSFCKNTSMDFIDYVSVFIQAFVKLLADDHERVQLQAWEALAAVTSSLDAAQQQQHINSVRNALRYVRNDEVVLRTGVLPGFCAAKKGLAPLLPMFREGILNGSPDMKEQAAKAIGECINYLTPAALKPSVVSITGPLIRILGDRFSWNVKLAILETLSLLLVKVGVFLKPFLPQLQTTFTKALQDPNRPVRLEAGKALANLCVIHTRIDPLFTELSNNVRSADDVSIKETSLQALRGCVRSGGAKISEKIKVDLLSTLKDELGSSESNCRNAAAACLAVLCSTVNEDEVTELIDQHILAKDIGASLPLRQGRSALLAVALKESPSFLLTDAHREKILDHMLDYVNTDRVQIVTDGIHAAAYLLHYYSRTSDDVPSQVVNAFKSGLEHSSNDMKTESARSIGWCMQQLDQPSRTEQANGDGVRFISFTTTCFLLPLLLARTSEKNTGVRSAAEHAIVSLLRLRRDDSLLQKCVKSLTSSEAALLSELFKQKLKRIASSTEVIEVIDNTLIRS